MRTITCYCDNIVDCDFPENLNLKENPNCYNEITNGSFQSIKCNKCGTLLKPELTVRLYDEEKGIDLLYIPESDRNSFFRGELNCDAPRLAIGFPELVEKIKLIGENLDDGAVEIIKYYLKKKAASDEITILFDHLTEDCLIFHIWGLKDDQIAISKIPVTVYHETKTAIKSDADSELYTAILSPPYISANKLSVMEDN